MNWVGSGLVALAGVMAAELILVGVQRLRLARSGDPIPELVGELLTGAEAETESLRIEGQSAPEGWVTAGQSRESLEKSVRRNILREIDRAVRIRMAVAAIVWPLATVCMVLGRFSWMQALILVIPAVLVNGSVVGLISRAVVGRERRRSD